MELTYSQLEQIIFSRTGFRRFTQDSSILPDVWMEYGQRPDRRHDLLLTPTWGFAPGALSLEIEKRIESDKHFLAFRTAPESSETAEIAYNGSTIAVKLFFDQLIRVILPMTGWWEHNIIKKYGSLLSRLIEDVQFRDSLVRDLSKAEWDTNRLNTIRKNGHSQNEPPIENIPEQLVWLMKIVGAISLGQPRPAENVTVKTVKTRKKSQTDPFANVAAIVDAFAFLLQGVVLPQEKKSSGDGDKAKAGDTSQSGESLRGSIWAVNLNREAKAMIWKSTNAVKADASRRLFEVRCDDIRWAVIDSGIDATHPAFRMRDSKGVLEADQFKSRVIKTFDFTMIRSILSGGKREQEQLSPKLKALFVNRDKDVKALRERLLNGRAIDWDILGPILEVPHRVSEYRKPIFEHGTHVAGIIAADWRAHDEDNEESFDIRGVCPDLALYDLRVLDDNGQSDEFSVLAALQFAQYINTNSEYKKLHGVNLSLSIRHKVKNFACGCTPVCEEAERMVNAGLVVVAAAGNDGYLESNIGAEVTEGYRSISITDPGNAQGVITVGATHRDSPHTYGVSYFSSRGPTGDGRIKPDIVAPGEKIYSTVPGSGLKPMDGTSMAAPHVSGAAALLIGRHRELIGRPVRVKEILCATATDLGRERYFQGHGMLDILRAMQSV